MKEFNLYDVDDAVFPTTKLGQAKAVGLVLESATADTGKNILEEAAASTARAQAMSAVLGWVGDGQYDYTALDEYIMGVCDLDGDFEIGEDETALYNDVWAQVPDALMSLGASEEDANAFCNDEDEAAGARIGATVSSALDDMEADDDQLIASFSEGEDSVLENASDDKAITMVLEATFKKMKLVRGGKIVLARKRVSGKVRLSAAQRAGLKKARRKAFSSTAKLHRAKSMRLRKRRGL